MRSISLQLHATSTDIVQMARNVPEMHRGEVLGYVRNRVEKALSWTNDLETEAMRFRALIVLPQGVEAIIGEGLDSLNQRCAPLVFGMPDLRPEGLRDTMIGCRDVTGQFLEQITRWRKYLNACRKPLIKGATVTNPGMGSRYYPNMWATAAAVAMSGRGTPLIVGNSMIATFECAPQRGG